MAKRTALIALALGAALLSGCATEVTTAIGKTVVVRAGFPDIGPEKALGLANAECSKRNLSAKLQQMTSPMSDRYIFECV